MIHNLKIDGQSYPFKFDLIAACNFEEETDRSIALVFTQYAEGKGRIGDIIKMTHHGLQQGHKLSSKEYTWTWEDVARRMQTNKTLAQDAITLISADQEMPEEMQQQAEEAKKKPGPKKSTSPRK